MAETDRDLPIEQFEVEIADLEPIAGSVWSWPARCEAWLLRWQRPERRRVRRRLSVFALGSLLLLLVVVVLGPATGLSTLLLTSWPFYPGSSPATASDSVDVGRGSIVCPVQTAWSPNSSLIAVLGYTQPCVADAYTVAQVSIYSAITGRQIGDWQPDDLLLNALQQALSPTMRAILARKPDASQTSSSFPTPTITYQQIAWSPTGTQLALSFSVTTRFESYAGLLLASSGGERGRVFLRATDTDTQSSPPTASGRAALLRWNLQDGSSSQLSDLKPALSYAWGANDQLLPVTDSATSGRPTTYTNDPPGNPDGGRSFTVWQPGSALVVSFIHTPGAYLWATSFTVWSPDGRYLLTNFSFVGMMEPPGQPFPDAAAFQQMDIDKLLEILPHDPALIPSALRAQVVAWNPAGTLLAVYALPGQVDLYNARTGQRLRSFAPVSARLLSGSTNLLSWSPNGRTLLLTSSQWGAVTLWSGQILAL